GARGWGADRGTRGRAGGAPAPPPRESDQKQLAAERAETALPAARRTLAAFEIGARNDLEVRRLETAKAERSVASATASLDKLVLKAPRPGVLVYNDHPWEGA